jgi:GMP synthase-like glutamine amidotransferase
VREARVYSEIVPYDITAEEVERRKPAAIILSGGPASVYADNAPRWTRRILELGIPILGFCYGMQLMALELGGDGAQDRHRRVRVRRAQVISPECRAARGRARDLAGAG